MDPPHITEFASERYFSKLNQLAEPSSSVSETHQNGRSPSSSSSAEAVHSNYHSSTPTTIQPPPASQNSSSFFLPLRIPHPKHDGPNDSTRTPDQQRIKPEKSRLRSLRSKVSFLHSKSQPSAEEPPPVPTVLSKSTTTSQSLDQRFLSLPNELQIQIICALPLSDVLNLRRLSKTWHALISLNEAPIVRHHLDHHIPAYALRLFPAENPAEANFHHLCGLWHRLHVATKLSFLICEWVAKDIWLRNTEAERAAFAPAYERMQRRLIPLLFTIFHFFETYRKLHLQHIVDHDGYGLWHEPYTLNPIEAQIMAMYDDQTLLRVHQVFPLVVSSFCRQLRPPTYVGRVERSLRGYFKEKPPDEVHTAILCLGGLRQVERFWEIKGYNSRRGAVDSWYNDLTHEPPPDTPAKSRRGLRGLGRKRSSLNLKDPTKLVHNDAQGVRRGSQASTDESYLQEMERSLVFNTSLSAGMPMEMLGHDNLRRILPDLPALKEIWLTTAEAIILDRKIVERPEDIKRNTQVLLDLIKDDGIMEEDEWWYGRSTPESVRPPLESIQEDPIEVSAPAHTSAS